MNEERTFSAVVDTVTSRALRTDRKADVISYARQTMRECQVLSLFAQDMVEDLITTTAAPHIWTVPQEFRMIKAVEYPIQDGVYEPLYPPLRAPGKTQGNADYYYYRAADYYVFAGLVAGADVKLAYYAYFKQLVYFDVAARPAQFDLDTLSWVYAPGITTDEQKLAARERVTNWLLQNWFDLIVEGTLAKLYKTVADQRQGVTYSLYKSYQKDLLAGEAHESLQVV